MVLTQLEQTQQKKNRTVAEALADEQWIVDIVQGMIVHLLHDFFSYGR